MSVSTQPPSRGIAKHIIIGTAGHIDHGKTRLVRALTGIDTDRLPEERARGISIDLGFAHWEAEVGDAERGGRGDGGTDAAFRRASDWEEARGELPPPHPGPRPQGGRGDLGCGPPSQGGRGNLGCGPPSQGGRGGADAPVATSFRFGIVDVPGHERFIKNMVAGASGVDIALLVVAADDSVMPQTREHLEILDLLGVRAGLVAVTKIDMVDREYVELVADEVRELTAGTCLEGCPIVPVSSASGEGLDELRATIVDLAARFERPAARQVFRMPIDRVFSVAGHGTVVTGTVLGGRVAVGDTVELQPGGAAVRVRGLQTHDRSVEACEAGQRTALNLAGVKAEELERGHEVAASGYLQPTRRMLVELQVLPSARFAVKDRMQLRVHLGTRESPVRVITKGRVVAPGEKAFVELRMQEPMMADYGQRFIVRLLSPALTVAGGRVLDPHVEPRRRVRNLEEVGRSLAAESELDRLAAVLRTRDAIEASPLAAALRTGIAPERYGERLKELARRGDLVRLSSGGKELLVERHRYDELCEQVLARCRRELERRQPVRALPRVILIGASRAVGRPEVVEAIFDAMVADGRLATVGGNFCPADSRVALTKQQQRLQQAMLEASRAGGLSPPLLSEQAKTLGEKVEALKTLATLLVEEGRLVLVGEGYYAMPDALERGRQDLLRHLREKGPATVSDLREVWQVSRKYAVPLCEFFDARGVTVREGDRRKAGPKAEEAIV